MQDKLSFQEIILRLINYWKEQGCLVWQPYNVQVGAGTMNPATVLRVLGPEPWNVAYVEPSIRPDDGRFGDNPNRMQQHYQLQVILKPDPGNPIELYLQSLEAIGINLREHDIRFVEDNWASPALGAWGLGWEVWLDGQEITQYTYFQQAGGIELEPVSVEITYGLDRISLALQGVDSVWKMEYGSGVFYGDALLQAEIEHCRYYFEVADVDALRMIYDTYEREALRCLEAGLVVPAHDYNLKCSHLFNVLDTRGAIGVTERAKYFQRMRRIAGQVAEAYVEQRQRLEYPFFDNPNWSENKQTAAVELERATADPTSSDHETFLLEIGSEELPAGDLTSALRQLTVAVPTFLKELRLDYDSIDVQGTPRRLAVMVSKLASRQPDLETEVKGPPADRAFDAEGKPTQAAVGFARSRGIPVESLQVREEGGRRYVTAVVREAGRPAIEVLAERLPDLIAGLKFERSMRWNETKISYSRPLRWLVALFGRTVVPFEYGGAVSSRTTYGIRPYGSLAIEIAAADEYGSRIAEQGILLNVEQRREVIDRDVRALAASKLGTIPDDSGLLAEVTNLVERPTPLLGEFERRFLALPAEVLVAVMRKHQRYFPLYHEKDGRLLPYFIAVRNGDDQHLDIVAEGNEHVIRARFSDAEFFYNKDRQRKLADWLPELDKLTFQADLGSMLDKSHRLEQLTPQIAEMLELTEEETATAARAATLSKADLATSMVVEMTSVQGIMGGHYARLSNEPEGVAAAIAEQYEAVSQTRPGLALALADRLDSLVGLFAVGLAPKGSNDPFAIRRAALQVIQNLLGNEVSFDLRPALVAAADLLPVPHEPQVLDEVLEFIGGRLEGVLREAGHTAAVVNAVLAEQVHNPYLAEQAAADLSEAITADDWSELLNAYARCVRITRSLPEQYPLHLESFTLPEEQALLKAYQSVTSVTNGSVPMLLGALRRLKPPISRFFDQVLVMDEDAAVRENRLALLQSIARLAQGTADLSHLEGF